MNSSFNFNFGLFATSSKSAYYNRAFKPDASPNKINTEFNLNIRKDDDNGTSHKTWLA